MNPQRAHHHPDLCTWWSGAGDGAHHQGKAPATEATNQQWDEGLWRTAKHFYKAGCEGGCLLPADNTYLSLPYGDRERERELFLSEGQSAGDSGPRWVRSKITVRKGKEVGASYTLTSTSSCTHRQPPFALLQVLRDTRHGGTLRQRHNNNNATTSSSAASSKAVFLST